MYRQLIPIVAILLSSNLYAQQEMTIVNTSTMNSLDLYYRFCADSSVHIRRPKPICNQPVHVTIPANVSGNKAYITLTDFTISGLPDRPFPGQFDRPMLEMANIMLNDMSGHAAVASSDVSFPISNKTAIIFNQPSGTSLLTSNTVNY